MSASKKKKKRYSINWKSNSSARKSNTNDSEGETTAVSMKNNFMVERRGSQSKEESTIKFYPDSEKSLEKKHLKKNFWS